MRFLILCLSLVAVVSCSSKKKPVADTCKNRSSSGACLDQASDVVDPNLQAALNRAQTSAEASQREADDLRYQLDQMNAQSGQVPHDQRQVFDGRKKAIEVTLGEIIKLFPGKKDKQTSTDQQQSVDVNQPPSVFIELRDGENPIFIFSHADGVSASHAGYGEKDPANINKFVYDYNDFQNDGIVIGQVTKIPVMLSFTFKGKKHCLRAEIDERKEILMQQEGSC